MTKEKKGVWETAVLDFKSQYPSAIIAENMCPTTYTTDAALAQRLGAFSIIKVPPQLGSPLARAAAR